MKNRTKIILSLGGASVIIATITVALWVKRFHHYTPIEVAKDIRAGIISEHAERPVEQFLANRYGTLTDPTNRERAFVDFFNAGHIEGLQILTSHMRADQRRTNILAMAEWLAEYRRTMSPQEKQQLAQFLASPEGRSMIHQATKQFLQQDSQYRATVAPVIKELMTTLSTLKQP